MPDPYHGWPVHTLPVLFLFVLSCNTLCKITIKLLQPERNCGTMGKIYGHIQCWRTAQMVKWRTHCGDVSQYTGRLIFRYQIALECGGYGKWWRRKFKIYGIGILWGTRWHLRCKKTQCLLIIQVTEIVSVDDWWYMSCKECWRKLKKESGIYKWPTCM